MPPDKTSNFDWSGCKLTDERNHAFLRGECDFIAGEWERKVHSAFLPTFLAVAVYAVLAYKTPLWFAAPIAVAVWLAFFWTAIEDNRELARLTPEATLLRGEVIAVESGYSADYGGSKLSVRFESSSGQVVEKITEASSPPERWAIGDEVVVLFADSENFWIL